MIGQQVNGVGAQLASQADEVIQFCGSVSEIRVSKGRVKGHGPVIGDGGVAGCPHTNP